jgi:predicted transcriptional regulator
MSEKNNTLQIDPNLRVRLKALASKTGRSFADFAESVLRSHADEEERKILERAEDEQRWQRYLAGGRTIPFETVRNKLHGLAAEAAQKAEPQ